RRAEAGRASAGSEEISARRPPHAGQRRIDRSGSGSAGRVVDAGIECVYLENEAATPGEGHMSGRVRILATGAYLPGPPIPFDDVEMVLGPLTGAPERVRWFIERGRPTLRDILGIDFYYYAFDPVTRRATETVSSLAAKAAREAMTRAGIEPAAVDLLCYGGAHPDVLGCPPTG